MPNEYLYFQTLGTLRDICWACTEKSKTTRGSNLHLDSEVLGRIGRGVVKGSVGVLVIPGERMGWKSL